MKKRSYIMRWKRYIPVLISGVCGLMLLSACCDPCSPNRLGQLNLQPASLDWIAYSTEKNIPFRNSAGAPAFYGYSDPESNLESIQVNCKGNADCGFCCDWYDGNTAIFDLTAISVGAASNFRIILRKNLVGADTFVNASLVPDDLIITMDNRLSCSLTLPDSSSTFGYEASVSLNGKSFQQVYICQVPPSQVNPNETQPEAFYFNKTQGIVGFKYTNGTVWNLED